MVEQIGAPLDLYDDPANQFVAGFVGSPRMNFLAAEVVARQGRVVTVALVNQCGERMDLVSPRAVEAGDRLTVGVRPEHFLPAGQGDVDLELAVDVAEHLGSTSYVYANTKGGEQVIVEREESRDELGRDRVTVSIPARRAYLFDAMGTRLK
jgi:lactose/L-arabinose transport system ATP-binding protein